MFKIGVTKEIDNDLLALSKHFKNKFHVDILLQHDVDERFILKNEIIMPPDWSVGKCNRIENKIGEVIQMYASMWGWDVFIPHPDRPKEIFCVYKYKKKNYDLLGFSN